MKQPNQNDTVSLKRVKKIIYPSHELNKLYGKNPQIVEDASGDPDKEFQFLFE